MYLLQNAHENEMAAMVHNEDYVFTSSISEIKVGEVTHTFPLFAYFNKWQPRYSYKYDLLFFFNRF